MIERLAEGIVECILGKVEVAEQADQRRKNSTRLRAVHRLTVSRTCSVVLSVMATNLDCLPSNSRISAHAPRQDNVHQCLPRTALKNTIDGTTLLFDYRECNSTCVSRSSLARSAEIQAGEPGRLVEDDNRLCRGR